VSSAEAADPAREVDRRHRRAQVRVALVYLGIPLLFLAVTVWIAAAQTPFAWAAVVFPVALLALGWFLRGRQRYQPGRWVAIGALFGGVSVLSTGIFSIALDTGWLPAALIPGSLLGVVLGVILGVSAQRAIMAPLLPELAATQYELALPLRGMPLLTLVVGTSSVSVRSRLVRSAGEGQRTYPLDEVTGVFPASLTGSERLKFPIALPAAPVASAGPALILQARGEDWVLPLGPADAVAEFLNRRVATAKL
jgi:hypothetical protein